MATAYDNVKVWSDVSKGYEATLRPIGRTGSLVSMAALTAVAQVPSPRRRLRYGRIPRIHTI